MSSITQHVFKGDNTVAKSPSSQQIDDFTTQTFCPLRVDLTCFAKLKLNFHEPVNARYNAKIELYRTNNVSDFLEHISFFWNKRYEKFFLACPEDVLSSVLQA